MHSTDFGPKLNFDFIVRNLQEKDKIFDAGALGNYSLAGFEMVSITSLPFRE